MAKLIMSSPVLFRTKLSEKLEEYGEAIANQDVSDYILLLVLKMKKSKEELAQDLEVFFEEQTDEFITWLVSCSKPNNQKVVRCKFFPMCKDSNCTFFHPTVKCKRYPNCKFGNKCLYLHEDEEVKLCSFGDKCTKGDACMFSHPNKKSRRDE